MLMDSECIMNPVIAPLFVLRHFFAVYLTYPPLVGVIFSMCDAAKEQLTRTRAGREGGGRGVVTLGCDEIASATLFARGFLLLPFFFSSYVLGKLQANTRTRGVRSLVDKTLHRGLVILHGPIKSCFFFLRTCIIGVFNRDKGSAPQSHRVP